MTDLSRFRRRQVLGLFGTSLLIAGLAAAPAWAKDGADDGPDHDSGDDHGGDDSHEDDNNDDNGNDDNGSDDGGSSHGGSDDPADHDANDDHGGSDDHHDEPEAHHDDAGGDHHGGKSAVDDSLALEVRYSDGFRESIANGVYTLTDPSGRVVTQRTALVKDARRMQALLR